MIARDSGGFPIEQEAYDATLRSLDRIIRENEQLRAKLDYRNREPPHCPTCGCGLHPSTGSGT